MLIEWLLLVAVGLWLASRLPAEAFARARRDAGLERTAADSRLVTSRALLAQAAGAVPLRVLDRCPKTLAVRPGARALALGVAEGTDGHVRDDPALSLAKALHAQGRALGWEAMALVCGLRPLRDCEELCFALVEEHGSRGLYATVQARAAARR